MMTIRRDLLFGVGALVALQLATSFSAIGVLTRTSPAVAQVLDANVYSLAAAEELLGVLARAGDDPLPSAERDRAAAALERLRRNLTEPGERELVEDLAGRLDAALGGDRRAARESVAALLRVGDLNRTAMRRADAEMQRLGSAGAWFAVAMGGGAFLLSLLVVRRLEGRLLAPLQELSRVLEAARAGRSQRRCQPVAAAPDVRRLLSDLNEVLDMRYERAYEEEAARRAERAALLHLLDARGTPGFVVDAEGRVAAASRRGLDALAADESGAVLKRRMADLPTREAAPEPGAPDLSGVIPLGEAGWLVEA